MKRLTALLVAVAALTAPALAHPTTAFADENKSRGDNSAVAINTKDDSSIFELAFSIREVAGKVVDNANSAVAYSSCERCRTVAIAIQIVLVTGNPDTVTPTNVAVAVNENCTLCTTFAAAYQIVLGTNGPVRLTTQGSREIDQIYKQIKALQKTSLPPSELKARLDDLVAELKAVLQTELVPDRDDDDDDDDDGDGDDDDDGDGGDDDDRPLTMTGDTSVQSTTAPTTTTTTSPTTTTTTSPSTTTTSPQSTTTETATTTGPGTTTTTP